VVNPDDVAGERRKTPIMPAVNVGARDYGVGDANND